MVEDVYEPLAKYRDEFKDKFARLVREKFRALLKRSGVDADRNRALVAQVRTLEREAEAQSSAKSRCGCLAAFSALVAVAGGFAWGQQDQFQQSILQYCVPAVVCGAALFVWLMTRRARAAERLRDLRARIDALKKDAWNQMAPLNRLYTWDIPQRLVEATVPRIAFDPFFSARRLDDLHRLCGWNDAFNDGKSVLGAQSGVINGNPFVFGHCLVAGWGTKVYEGYLDISWSEEVEDDEGNVHYETRHETLTATVEKPIPTFEDRKFLIYGNDAAPNLSFSRHPSELSGKEDGVWTRFRKGRELKKLEKFSRNLDDDHPYTLMGNREFEVLFQTKNRTNEVEYRLLFTALAQTQMLQLLKDRTVGYGDDFTFVKKRKINLLESAHLDAARIDTNPSALKNWSVDDAWAAFRDFNEKFFKDVYFSLAPILAIPLYQQTRPHADIWKGVLPETPSSFWEHESLANYYGDGPFRHPDCATRNILKTHVVGRADGVTRVAVTAHGYRAVRRVDYESVYGGDGCWHDVPVEWDEYLPVERTREMTLSERATPAESFRAALEKSKHSAFRRSILSYL
ncbi:MAG: MAG1210 family protein [Kiritimatiellia bacterium]